MGCREGLLNDPRQEGRALRSEAGALRRSYEQEACPELQRRGTKTTEAFGPRLLDSRACPGRAARRKEKIALGGARGLSSRAALGRKHTRDDVRAFFYLL